MPTTRKTVKVKDIIDRANHYFLHTPDVLINERKAVQRFVADILHNTGNYSGYNYLTEEKMKESTCGNTCGIKPSDKENKDKEPWIYPDESRIFFY